MLIDQTRSLSPLGCLYFHAKNRPDTVWMTQPHSGGQTTTYTWGQAADQVRRMAAHLASLDLPPNSQIALIGKNSAHWILADLAIWMAGHVTVPLYPTLAPETVSYILEHSESKLVFLGKLDDWELMAPGVPADMPRIALPLAPNMDVPQWDDLIAKTEPMQGEPDRKDEEMCTIVYTSGSTGKPKGVMTSFGATTSMARSPEPIIEMTENDRMLSYLPLAHIMERTLVELTSLYAGFPIFFAESLNTFVQDLQRSEPTVFLSVPRLWSKFMSGVCEKLPRKKQNVLFRIPFLGKKVKQKILTQLGLQHVRYAGTGSAPLPADIIDWYNSLGLELLEGYGMTENCAYSHGSRPGQTRVGYVGHANPGVDCKIGERNEILVRSPGNMMGYFKNPEKTAEDLDADGYLHTGDMGEIDEQGRLRITGRIKEMFKLSKGKYVAPVPIENYLTANDKVEVCCVGGANRAATFGLIVLGEDVRADLAKGSLKREDVEAELKALLEQTNPQLDPHEQLAFLVVVKDAWTIEDGYLTPTMKIKRNVIEEHYEAQLDDWYAARKPVIWE